jgi:hypothetical protein
MDSNRLWKILNWNLRGINSEKKWLALASKISKSNCDIVCLQETKRELFDIQYLRNFCPKKFNKFEYLPSVGASGGLIIMGLYLVEKWSFRMSFLCLSSLLVPCLMNPGFSQIFMDLVLLRENPVFWIGFPILICQMIWTG